MDDVKEKSRWAIADNPGSDGGDDHDDDHDESEPDATL